MRVLHTSTPTTLSAQSSPDLDLHLVARTWKDVVQYLLQEVGMKVTPYTVILFSVFALRAPADDIAGNWKASVVGGVRHKTISQATFDFKVDGNHLGGTAHIGNDESSYYPGTAPISKGEISGDRISFTVIGEHPSSSGLPIMKFDGTMHGEALDLTMILSFGSAPGDRMELKGERISK